ncbi:MAG: ParA family protein [Gammaproteobacteria bacterium]|nr:ParA family protein [Gammaproteobacteria bacterium]
MKFGEIKISEISKLTGISIPQISMYFKKYRDDKVTRINNRVIGISPEAAEEYLKETGHDYFCSPSITLFQNLCGGIGKTTGTISLGISIRRIIGRDKPVVYIDGDSQGSFTEAVFGKPADESQPVLVDFLEGKATLNDILTDVGNNIWFAKSNLNNLYLDRKLAKPQDIKNGMLRFYQEIFAKLGPQARIFQDHTPQLSNLFASSICALGQLDNSIHKSVVIPIRTDTEFAVSGTAKLVNEIEELKGAFGLKELFDIHCYLSMVDRRLQTTAAVFKKIGSNQLITQYLSDAVIRYSQEIPKSIEAKENIFSSGKTTNATEDYLNLMQHILKPRQDSNGAA